MIPCPAHQREIVKLHCGWQTVTSLHRVFYLAREGKTSPNDTLDDAEKDFLRCTGDVPRANGALLLVSVGCACGLPIFPSSPPPSTAPLTASLRPHHLPESDLLRKPFLNLDPLGLHRFLCIEGLYGRCHWRGCQCCSAGACQGHQLVCNDCPVALVLIVASASRQARGASRPDVPHDY